MDGVRLPGTSADDGDRIVAHVDMDCFYAACERRREPDRDTNPALVREFSTLGEVEPSVPHSSRLHSCSAPLPSGTIRYSCQ
ncbi:DNA polymerase IV [Halomicrobium sp. LC1Hm]|nr:DNA polymerase IV [Halomicrobium sp. LC1Hm]